jgi:chromosome segregation protein
MHLKNIKLSGFKSFVDPTTVPFTKNLIAVVGPNGCGKSNIVDAIRWVMGESSAKTLRGESMADVIFNGSTTRKPVGQASVQLTFDNSDGSIGGEYAQYAEIAIKRVASRDGTSSYYLNNTKCRRKDITDVFLGTGLGPRSYSVIEQGMISRFIEAKPDDLRVYMEEAAGISKYKERRRETETRIRHTRENLDRVQDLRDEIGKQLEKLQRQAKAAERYKVLKQDERLNKAQLHALHWKNLNTQMENFAQIIKTAEVAIEERIAEQRHIGAQIENIRELQIDASDELNEVQGRYYGLGAEIAKLEQSITHYRERFQQLQEDKERIEESVTELQQNTQDDQQRLTAFRQELIQVEPKFHTAKASLTGSREALDQAEDDMQSWRQQWNEFSQEAAKALQQAEVEQTRMKHAEQRIKELTARIENLTYEQQQFDFSELSDELGLLSETKLQVESQVEQLKTELAMVKEQLTHEREQTETITTKWDQAKESLQTAKGRFASLTALQQAALGDQGDSVITWLEKNQLADKPRLAQQLSVNEGWEKAVETVLGTHLEAICVDDFDAVENLLTDTPDGTFEFAIANSHASVSNNTAGKLSAKVSGNQAALGLLSSIYCTEDLISAKAMLAQLQTGESIITRDGLWLSQHWLRVAKDKDEKTGVLQRENQLTELRQHIARLEEEVDEYQQHVEQGKQTQHELELQKEQLQQQFNMINQQLSDARAEHQVKQEQLQQGNDRVERIHKDLQDQQEKLAQTEEALQTANNNWQHAISNSEHHATRKLELEALGSQYTERLNLIREQARVDAEQAHQLEVRVEQLKPQIETLQSSIQRAENQLKVLFERSSTLAASIDEGEGPVAELQSELAQALSKRVAVEQELINIRQKVENFTQQMREFEDAKEAVALAVEKLRRDLEEKRLEGRTVDVRKKTIEEQIVELDYQLETILQELPENANVKEWEEEAERIITRISRLGPINLAAIEEFKVQEERKQYLDSQHEDLNEALTTLENAISKIDKETRSRFKETFDKVNDGFKELFPKVFGGGSAYLELTGDDLLDTGISVIARPPGKRNTTIHLLSGGEKALTAVSLVFAIFHLNPAPFCLLDEVDAPLDDANVGRFCSLVKEMSEKVQFLFISHNKLAIEMAEQLTGVTMQEPGVSRIVAVDMEEAVQLAAA